MNKFNKYLAKVICLFVPFKIYRKKIRAYLHSPPPTDMLIIESSSVCQIRCVWCSPQKFDKHPRGFMSAEQFESIISKNHRFIKKNYGTISPYSRGEPFIHPDIWDIFAILEKYGLFQKQIDIHSNLSMMLDADKLIKYSNLRIVANFGGTTKEVHEKVMLHSDFDLVVKNFKTLADNNVNVIAKITPTKQNLHQIDLFQDFVNKIAGKDLKIMIGTTGIMAPYSLSKEEMTEYFNDIVSPEMDKHLRFTYDLDADDKNIIPKSNKCPFLIHTILYDGQVTICCHDKQGKINCGNVFEKTLEEIVQSKKFQHASEAGSKMELQICKACN